MAAHHDHARHPEEDDVVARDEHAAGQIQVVVAGGLFTLPGPAQCAEGHQGGGIPSVEHVGVALQRAFIACRAGPGAGLLLAAGHEHAPVFAIPGRNLVPPPELAADAPVLNVAHPLVVGVHPLPGHKAHLPALHGVDGFLRDGFRLALAHFAHGDEPLVGQHRLHHLARAGANGQHVFVRLDVDDITARLQIGQELLARLVAVQPLVGRGAVFIDARLRREDGDERQVMPLGAGVVVEVVRAGDLHAAGAEFAIDEVVGNDGNVAVVQRQLHPLAHQVAVALVFGVHGQRAVGHHGFGARGGNGHAALQLAVNHLRAIHEGIADVVHLAVGLHAFHFQIAHRAFERRVPVHQALAPVNQALLIQAHEGFGHHF